MAKVKFGSLKADLKAEAEGVWIDSADLEGVRFKVSSLYSPGYVAARDLMVARLQRKHGKKGIPPEERAREIGQLYAEHILHDWTGFDVDYTEEAAREALSNPEYRVLLQAVENAAAEASQVAIDFDEDLEKNSGTRSAAS